MNKPVLLAAVTEQAVEMNSLPNTAEFFFLQTDSCEIQFRTKKKTCMPSYSLGNFLASNVIF